MPWCKYLSDESATINAGKALGKSLSGGGVIFLQGTLGAGKTTFCRGIMSAFGHSGVVKSPTYTLVEPYEFNNISIFHFDLYRLGDPEELEYMGIRDYFQSNNLCLVEWPSRGREVLPEPDVSVDIIPEGEGRAITLLAHSTRGQSLLASLES